MLKNRWPLTKAEEVHRLLLPSLAVLCSLIAACQPGDVSLEESVFATVPETDLPADVPEVLTLERKEMVRSRFARFDFEDLKSKLLAVEDPARAMPIELTLFDDLTISVSTERVDTSDKDIYVWKGNAQSEYYSRFSLSFNQYTIFGMIQVDATVYEIIPVGDNIVMIAEIDQTKYPEEAPPIIPETKYQREDSSALEAPADEARDAGRLKVLVVLPLPSYRFFCNGSFPFFDILDLVEAAFQSNLNDVFNAINSTGIQAAVEVECHDYKPVGGDLRDDLTWVRTDGAIADLRDNREADLVSLIVPDADFCGRGYETYPVTSGDEEWAFTVVKASCALGNYSFAHELGHNFGMRHDRIADDASASDTCNYGHIFPVRILWADTTMRSVMAYGSSCGDCSRAGLYSMPVSLDFGFIKIGPMGVGCNTPASNEDFTRANNRQQLIDAAPVASAFR